MVINRIIKEKKISRLTSLIRKKIFAANSKKIVYGSKIEPEIAKDIARLKKLLSEAGFKKESSLSQDLLIKKIILPAFIIQVRP